MAFDRRQPGPETAQTARAAVTTAVKPVFGSLAIVLAIVAWLGMSAVPSFVHAEEGDQPAGICDRTPQVRDAILAELDGVDDCTDVTSEHLATVYNFHERLENAGIESIKAGDFDGLDELTSLRLGGNSISALPPGIFDDLIDLRTLTLDDNQLTALSEGFFDDFTDEFLALGLSGNEIASLPEGIFDPLTNLNGLWLNDNELTTLPSGIFDELPDLAGLRLNDNQLTSLPEDLFDHNPELSKVYLGNNAISALPEDLFEGTPKLSLLSLTGTEVEAMPEDMFDGLTGLTHLYLYGNSIASLPEDIFDGLTGLEALSLSGNEISELPADVFDGLTSLWWMSLANNELTSLPVDIFDDLDGLRMLVLSGNSFAQLPEGIFDSNDRLWFLSLEDNELASLPAGFLPDRDSPIRSFCLDLSGNELEQLPDDFLHVQSSHPVVVQLEGNPGAPFAFTMEAELVSQGVDENGLGTAQVLYKVLRGAPVRMEGALSVSGGTASASSVVVRPREVYSPEITVAQSAAGEPVTLTLGDSLQLAMEECIYWNADGEEITFEFNGITFEAGSPLVLFEPELLTADTVPAGQGTPAVGNPAIDGTAQVGMTLTADTSSIEDADGLTNVAYSYQWIRSDQGTDTDIAGGTGSSYTLVEDDAGNRIKVKVSFTDDGGNQESLTSVKTDVVETTVEPDTEVALPVHITRADWIWESADPHLTVNIGFTIHEDPGDTSGPDIYFMLGYGHLGGTTWYAGLQTKVFRQGEWNVGKGVIFSRWGTRSLDHTRPTEAGWARSSGHEGDFVGVRHPYPWTTGSYTLQIGPDASGNGWYGAWITEHESGETTWLGSLRFDEEEGHGTWLVSVLEAYGNQPTKMADIPLSKITIEPPHNERGERPTSVYFIHSETVTNHDVEYDEETGEVTFTAGGNTVQRNIRWPSSEYVVPSAEDAVPNSAATGAPTISGTAQVGETLTADTSDISDANGLDNVTYSYQWVRSDGGTDTDISGETGSTYTLVTVDLGKTIKVRVSFTDDSDNEESLTSAQTDVVEARPNSPATGVPTISGTAQVGETLTVDTSDISDDDGLDDVVYGYQWLADNAEITGTTNSNYTLDADDLGKTFWVKVSFIDDAGHEETLTSAQTAVVEARPNSPATGIPTISGTAQVGETLTVDTSSISDADGLDDVVYGYQWVRSDGGTDTDISGETGSTYTLVTVDLGKTIKVRVSFTDDSDNEESLTSAQTDVVEARPNSPATGVPTISGTAQVGETLTVDTSDISDGDGLDDVVYGYQWLAADAEIARATNSTYTLDADDLGKTMKVRVSFTDDAGNEESLTSVATEPVAEALPNNPATGLPAIGGTAQVGETLTADTSDIEDEDGLPESFTYLWRTIDEGSASTTVRVSTTSNTYRLWAADKGKTVTVQVNFTDDAGNQESLTSEATEPVAARSENWVVDEEDILWSADMSVVDQENGTIGAVQADQFSNVGGSADLQAQWLWSYTPYRNLRLAFSEVVPGAEELTLEVGDILLPLIPGDTNYSWKNVEVGWEDGQTISVRLFPTSAMVAPLNSPATGAPTISGTAQVGETLTANTSAIEDADGLDNVAYSYQWLADDAEVAGATGSSYTLEDGDEDKTIKVRVSFTDDSDNEESLTSAQTDVVEARPNSPAEGLPTISGIVQVGETLTVDTSAIEDDDGLHDVVYGYQWLANDGSTDTEIEDATDSTYTLADGDEGKTTKVRVSFIDDAGYEESLTSEATSVVGPPNSPATGELTINGIRGGGTHRVGQTLTVDTSDINDADGLENANFGYQWMSGDGRTDSDIEGATSASYTLVTDNEGKAIRARVTFTDDGGHLETLISHRTAKVRGGCEGGSYAPTPTAVDVVAVPVVVESTTEEYFVLYVRPDLESHREIPVSVTLGQEGTTTLTEQLAALPKEHYRVEKYDISDPGDVDFDCISDIAELADPVGMNPLNPAPEIPLVDGAPAIPDHETFEALAYQSEDVLDEHLIDLEFVNFFMLGVDTDRPIVYFINTETRNSHESFRTDILQGVNTLFGQGVMIGEIVYHPDVAAPDGSLGVYRYQFLSRLPFGEVAYLNEILAASMPVLDNNLAYYPLPRALPLYDEERALYDASRINVLFEEDILPDVDFISLNGGQGYGFLRLMSLGERPNPRDIVIYEALPNELSRVAGIITTVPQTPLSHVNLRAVQDGAPNAFIRDALDEEQIDDLIGSYVHYTVTADGYTIRAATPEEVDAHYAASRPAAEQTPQRDLTVTQITALSGVEFDDWNAFGVKAANVAVMGTLDFPAGTVPTGFAIPFYFYDDIEELLEDTEFQTDFDTQEDELKKLRKKIKKGESPEWMITALENMHATYPEGQSLRYRSSTNNEDLPGFSGAGLYDSKTQHPDETEEDGIDKSLKQVFASLWNFRAFVERDFHRVEHLSAAMGVLVHPNYSDELANGVAVSFDPIHGTDDTYYVNTQLGEDLVTNPEAHSVPEEILLGQSGSYDVLATSNQVEPGQLLMSDAQLEQLRSHLEVIHDEFEELYGIEAGEPFAMEIEFKITSDNILAIKQARPWVFNDGLAADVPTGVPTISGIVQVGETLTADTSGINDDDGLDDVAFSYQWIRSDGGTDTDISGETGSTYTLVTADVGTTIKVRVNFTDDDGNDESLTSAATEPVAEALPNSPATGLPAISGTAQVGERLTADTSDISDADGLDNVAFSYQWLADDTEITGATNSTYTLDADDLGKTIRVRVSFTDDAGNEESLTSVATEPVAEALPNNPATGLPAIRGTVKVGERLTADTSDIADADGLPESFTYIWYATDDEGVRTRLPGSASVTLQADDRGKTVTVQVNFTDLLGTVESLTSEPTEAVVGVDRTKRPHDLRATASGDAIVLTWTDAVDGPDHNAYQILRHRPELGEPEPLVYMDRVQSTAPTFTDTDVEPGVLYVYRVKAVVDWFGHLSESSGPAEVRIPDGPAPEESNSPAEAVWSATLTVGTGGGYAGYSDYLKPVIGGLSPTAITVDGDSQTVRALGILEGKLGLVLEREVTAGFVLLVGTAEFSSENASTSRNGESFMLQWDDPGLSWSEGDEVAVSLTLTDGELDASTPLTVSLENAATTHNGTDPFTFEIRFSEEFDLSYRTLRDHAFAVTGGSVTKAKRVDKPSSILWRLTVQPDSNGDVTIILPATDDCEAEGAICTGDGRKLSNRLELTVTGPGQ